MARIRLENGLEALVISDPKTDFSGAMLGVSVGSFDEPKEIPGLAHFLEHMLFLGTKTYPEEAGFQKFISEGGGQTNAYTAPDATCYVFSIKNELFTEGLDRFSSFFKEPLFNPSGVKRELKAIDQEFAKNVEDDQFRQHYIEKELSNPNHPFRQFSIGNSKTLSHITQEELKTFWEESYSADLMKVVVLSNQPLSELIPLTDKLFSKIKTVPQKPKSPLGKTFQYEGHLVAIEPIKQQHSLNIIFELPASFVSLKRSKPERILSYLLGHEGEGSLIATLREEHLAETLSCGAMRLSKDNVFFVIDIDLTPQGLKNLKEVYERVFQALYLLKTETPPSFLFEEMHQNERLNYQYQQKMPVFAELMTHAHYLLQESSLSTYPEETMLVKEIRPEEVKALAEALKPREARFEIKAPLKDLGLTADREEQWMGCAYTVQKIEEADLLNLENVKKHPHIHFPNKNHYISQNFSLFNEVESEAFLKPKILIDNAFGKFFFSQDTHYFLPKIHSIIDIKTPLIVATTPEKLVMGDLFVKHVTEKLQRIKSSANAADLDFLMTRQHNGIRLTIEGLSDKAPLLLKDILEEVTKGAPSQEKFQIYKNSILREYQNFKKEPPLTQCVELLKKTLFKDFVQNQEKVRALKTLSLKKYKEFVDSLFKETYLEGMLFGNFNEESALQFANILLKTFSEAPYQEREKEVIQSLPQTPSLAQTTSKTMGHALILCIEEGYSPKARAAQTILMQGLKEPFFSTLRTKQQTGYIVQSADECLDKHLFNLFLVQSNTHEPNDLLYRFELFLEEFLQELTTASIPEERFEALKHSEITLLKAPPKNMSQLGFVLHKLAFKEEERFEKNAEEIEALKELTYEEFVKLAKSALGRQNKRRLASVLKGVIDNPFEYTHIK